MRDETAEQPAPLRSGLTTGSCATATSLAAARLLLSGVSHDAVHITLPKGKQVQMRLEFCRPCEGGAEAGTIKDAGGAAALAARWLDKDPTITREQERALFAPFAPDELPPSRLEAAALALDDRPHFADRLWADALATATRE